MAWWYYASLRVQNEFQADHLWMKYHGQPFTFNRPDGAIGCVPARMVASSNQATDTKDWWVTIGCYDITGSGIANEDEARKANEFDHILYGMLRNERHFDYGLITVEPSEFRDVPELVSEFKDGTAEKLHGLMVSLAFLEGNRLNDAITHNGIRVPWLAPFSPSHLWVPKKPNTPAGIYADKPRQNA